MNNRRTPASIVSDYRKAIEHIRELTKTDQFVDLKTAELIKFFRVRTELFRVMTEIGMIERQGKQYRWAMGLDTITDKLVAKVYEKTVAIRTEYSRVWAANKAKGQAKTSKRRNGAAVATLDAKPKRAYTRRAENPVSASLTPVAVKFKGTCFGLAQLNFMRKLEFDKPTTVLFDNGCQYEEVRLIEFEIDGSKLLVKFFINATTITKLDDLQETSERLTLIGRMPLVNRKLALSHRFGDNQNGNMFIEILPL